MQDDACELLEKKGADKVRLGRSNAIETYLPATRPTRSAPGVHIKKLAPRAHEKRD